jgi:hypothetical protein
MPKTSTIITGLVLLILGVVLRFRGYFVLEQMALKLLIAASLVIFIYLLIINSTKIALYYKDFLYFAVIVAILCGFSYESPTSNKLKNQMYLERLSRVINGYIQRHNRTPEIFDDALADSLEVLPNRGDADGNSYFYIRISERIYILRTLGPNHRNDFGGADDVQIIQVAGTSMSFDELSVWVHSQGTVDEREALENYRPLFQVTR